MEKIKLELITPERIIFSASVDQISLMTESGEITVLPHHIPLITVLKPGELRYKKDGMENFLAVAGGFAEIKADNTVSILADSAEKAEEIDIKRAEEAHARALETMRDARHKEDVDFVALQSSMERALNRLKIGNKYRKLPPTMKK